MSAKLTATCHTYQLLSDWTATVSCHLAVSNSIGQDLLTKKVLCSTAHMDSRSDFAKQVNVATQIYFSI